VTYVFTYVPTLEKVRQKLSYADANTQPLALFLFTYF